jgi:hypothetical protein
MAANEINDFDHDANEVDDEADQAGDHSADSSSSNAPALPKVTNNTIGLGA